MFAHRWTPAHLSLLVSRRLALIQQCCFLSIFMARESYSCGKQARNFILDNFSIRIWILLRGQSLAASCCCRTRTDLFFRASFLSSVRPFVGRSLRSVGSPSQGREGRWSRLAIEITSRSPHERSRIGSTLPPIDRSIGRSVGRSSLPWKTRSG